MSAHILIFLYFIDVINGNIIIIFTLLNLIYQLRTVLTEIPLPIYLLIAGLTILGVVTYKMKKELGKK